MKSGSSVGCCPREKSCPFRNFSFAVRGLKKCAIFQPEQPRFGEQLINNPLMVNISAYYRQHGLKIVALLLSAMHCVSLMAQPHCYTLSSDIPARYRYNSDSTYRALMAVRDPGLPEALQKDYAASLSYYHDRLLHSGEIYFNWVEIETYLNALVGKITGSIRSERQFKVFLLRNEDVNASAQDNGIIYINIGLLAEIETEADLVNILAHEISHALNADLKKMFMANARVNKTQKVKDILSLSHDNRIFEARADSFGFVTARDLNYDLSSSYHTYKKFESDYRWYKSQYAYQDPKWYIALDEMDANTAVKPDSLEKFLLSHPENARRLKALNSFIITRGNGTQKFSGNEAFFKSIKNKARLEQLYIEFTEAAYTTCLRNAFYYHLGDQNNTDYLYYITECLRRIILSEPANRRKGFLTEDSKEAVFEKNKGILHDVSFISLDTAFASAVKRDPVYGSTVLPFETYQQAYDYFYKRSAAAGVEELLLLNGLFELNRGKRDKGRESLESYVARPTANYTEFVNAVLSDELMTVLQGNKKDYVYVETPEYFVRDSKGVKYSYAESAAMVGQMQGILNSGYTGDQGFTTVFLRADSLAIVEYNLYDRLAMQLQQFKSVKEAEFFGHSKMSRNEEYWAAMQASDPQNTDVLKRSKNFFYLEPRYWTLFRDKQMHSFTRLKPYFYRHPLLGTVFYFELAYYDPVNGRYFYFDQAYAERLTAANVKKVFKRFFEQLNK